MKGKERIPLHDHRDFNSGGNLDAARIARSLGLTGTDPSTGSPHTLDGSMHLDATGTGALLSTTGHSGLLLPLSGSVGDTLRGDGTWGSTTETPFDHGAMGATETIDLADGAWHRGTLNTDCTTTISGFVVDEGQVALLEIEQDGSGNHAITWDADVDFGGVDDQPDLTPLATTFYLLFTSAGDSAIHGAKVGAGVTGGTPALTLGTTNVSGSATTALLTDATIAIFDATVPVTQAFGDAAATGSAAVAARRDHKHGMPSTAAISAAGFVGELLISDSPSTPLVFADLLQNESQSDLIYADV